MKIVITGSLGNIGRPLSKQLIADGHIVTIISSNNSRQQEIESSGSVAAIGFLDDEDFLIESFKGADAVFCMIPPSYTQHDQIAYYKRLAESYKKAIFITGVKRVVHLSSWGAHLPSGTGFITGSYHSEQILNSIKGIQIIHVRPTSFYYNLEAFIPMIKKTGFIGAVYGGDDLVAMVSPIDIAAAVAEELVNPKGSTVCYVSSDDRTCSEYATILGNAIGNPDLKWITMSKEDVRTNLLNNGLSEEYADKLVELGEAIHTGKLREDYDKQSPTPGKVKIENYAQDFAQIFLSK